MLNQALDPSAECAVLLDTKGPEIRTGMTKGHLKVSIKAGQLLDITSDYEHKGTDKMIACSYHALCKTVKPGSIIFIADGSLTCIVKKVHENHVTTECQNDYELGEKKNMNLPGAVVDLPTLTEKDIDDI